MIISRRDEGMAVACQGLTADLVISSSMFEGACGESNTSGAKSGMRGAGDQWIYCHAAVLLLCFFVLTQWTCREQGAFFIGHMPLHNDLWTQALCSLILLSMHYVARPSVTLWGRREASSASLPLTIHTLTMVPLCTLSQLLSLSTHLDCKLLKAGDNQWAQCRVFEF